MVGWCKQTHTELENAEQMIAANQNIFHNVNNNVPYDGVWNWRAVCRSKVKVGDDDLLLITFIFI